MFSRKNVTSTSPFWNGCPLKLGSFRNCDVKGLTDGLTSGQMDRSSKTNFRMLDVGVVDTTSLKQINVEATLWRT